MKNDLQNQQESNQDEQLQGRCHLKKSLWIIEDGQQTAVQSVYDKLHRLRSQRN